MEKIDPFLVDNALIVPEEKMLTGAFAFRALDDRPQLAYGGDRGRARQGLDEHVQGVVQASAPAARKVP